jgi:tRNA G26 N,N-dimethylase Trm1
MPGRIRRKISLQIIELCILLIFTSADKCNKGVEVLLSSCIHDHFLIIVRVLRGAKEGDRCVEKITPLLHCQMCEERVFYPNSLSPQGMESL